MVTNEKPRNHILFSSVVFFSYRISSVCEAAARDKSPATKKIDFICRMCKGRGYGLKNECVRKQKKRKEMETKTKMMSMK